MRSPRTHALWTELNYPHFVTSVTKDRACIFADAESAKMLLTEMRFYAEKYDVLLIAAVVMPDHFHAIIWPQGKKTFSDYMRGVKGYMAKWYGDREVKRGTVTPPIKREDSDSDGLDGADRRALIDRRGHRTPPSAKSYIPKIWQDSFFDYVITDDTKLEEKIWYIIRNPVEEKLVAENEIFPYLIIHPEYDPR